MTTSIRQVDAVAEERLDQLDEIAARRVENLDVIATKQSLSLEGMLVRIAALVGFVALIAFVAWRAFREAADALSYAKTKKLSAWTTLGTKAGVRFLPQLALAAGGAALLWHLSNVLPRDSVRRADEQIAQQRRAFDAAVESLDVVAARYHASQLEILEPAAAEDHRRRLNKVVLLHAVFTRPGQLRTPEGLAELVGVSRSSTDRCPTTPRSRSRRRTSSGKSRACSRRAVRSSDAVRRCPRARAEVVAGAARPQLHRALPRRSVTRQPQGGMTTSQLASIATAIAAAPGPFAHVINVPRRRDIEARPGLDAAYLDMLDAQADLEVELAKTKVHTETTATSAARFARTQAANRISRRGPP